MQVYRTIKQLLLASLLIISCGCASQAQGYSQSAGYSEAELDQMLAPIALYPDSVLTHVLIAATYPLEVVQATRWLAEQPGLTGEAAVEAASYQDWDPSVQALTAFPQLLQRLNDDLNWTQQLGEAFLTDEVALLASIQRLRQRAYAKGSLRNTQHLVVERQREVIVIEPARREIVYVPYYDTRVVYGDWWWPSYPPVYWYAPAGYHNRVTFYWGSGFSIRPSFYFSIFDWQHRHVVVHHHYYHKPPRYYPKRQHFKHAARWEHNRYHRRGVHYRYSEFDSKHRSDTHPSGQWRAVRHEQQPAQHQGSFIPADSRLRQSNQRQEEARLRQAQRDNAQQANQPAKGRIAQQWAENKERMTPIAPAVTEQSNRPQPRLDAFNKRQAEQQRLITSRPDNAERIHPITRPYNVQRLQQVQRGHNEERVQPIERPENTQRIQHFQREVNDQRIQPIQRPVQEQRVQPSPRPQQEQRVQPIQRPEHTQRIQHFQRGQNEQRVQPIQRPDNVQRVQPSQRPQHEQRIQSARFSSAQAARVEQQQH